MSGCGKRDLSLADGSRVGVRVPGGGSFFNGAANVRSALKIRNDARFKFSDIDFRIVKEKE